MIAAGYRDLTEVQQQFATDSQFFHWIGEALLVAKQTAEAKIAFERALELRPNSASAEARVAAAYLQEENIDAAIAHFERAMELDPSDLATASTLFSLYKQQGRVAESLELSRRIKAAMSQTAEMAKARAAPAASNETGTAGAFYKNIQVLKDVPAGELMPAMRFISSSLGVECSFCHLEAHFDKDEKKPKQVARDMMKMMFALNQSNFAGHREVTCYSCHRGSLNPVTTPEIGTGVRVAAESGSREQGTADLPTVGQLIENYIQALAERPQSRRSGAG